MDFEQFEFSEEEWNTCIKVLHILRNNPAHNPDNLLFSGLVQKINKKYKHLARQASQHQYKEHDFDVFKETIMVKNALENTALFSHEPIDYAPEIKGVDIQSIQLIERHNCYSCNNGFRYSHFFYHRLCQECAKLNYANRTMSVDLTGRYAIITGGRTKVGFATALRLLDCGASVCVTTRFPALALENFKKEKNYEQWKDRLFVYGLDLRSISQIQNFIQFYHNQYPSLDILINNAAQTIQYPTEYYAPIIQEEKKLLALQHTPNLIENKNLDTTLQSNNEIALSDLPKTRFGQPVDYRSKNSWLMGISDVGLEELVEVNVINQIAPTLLIQGFRELIKQSPCFDRFIINVTSSEGLFYHDNKTHRHPHTNMTKAALNMLTRTSAPELNQDNIYMTAVDVGWISTGVSEEFRQKQFNEGIIPPLDCVDGASRILHPIHSVLVERIELSGHLVKDYKLHTW